MREKLIELSKQLRYCANVSDCETCKRFDKVCEQKCVDNLLLEAAELLESAANGVVISNSETTTKWIPVTERLPRYNEEVLVYRPKMAIKIYVSSYEGYYGEDDDEWHEGWGICGDITHWMPLP